MSEFSHTEQKTSRNTVRGPIRECCRSLRSSFALASLSRTRSRYGDGAGYGVTVPLPICFRCRSLRSLSPSGSELGAESDRTAFAVRALFSVREGWA
jgi:hypothetical protein